VGRGTLTLRGIICSSFFSLHMTISLRLGLDHSSLHKNNIWGLAVSLATPSRNL
jgi:hypothetical protein